MIKYAQQCEFYYTMHSLISKLIQFLPAVAIAALGTFAYSHINIRIPSLAFVTPTPILLQSTIPPHSPTAPTPSGIGTPTSNKNNSSLPTGQAGVGASTSPTFSPTTPPVVKKTPSNNEALQQIADKLNSVKHELESIQLPSTQPVHARIADATLYNSAAERVVNFLCRTKNGEIAVATGVFIDPRGFLITNAHVAEDSTGRCLIRKGSPAQNYVWAEMIFFPTDYTASATSNATLRRDISIWKVVESATKDSLPSTFPSYELDASLQVQDGTKLETFSYPAELLSYSVIINSLYMVFSETDVEAHDSFFIQSVEGVGSQKGSSGGVLIDPYTGKLAGVIFAVSSGESKAIIDRKTYSLTPYAINETVRLQTGKNIPEYLSTPL
jgi:hypothetical protein